MMSIETIFSCKSTGTSNVTFSVQLNNCDGVKFHLKKACGNNNPFLDGQNVEGLTVSVLEESRIAYSHGKVTSSPIKLTSSQVNIWLWNTSERE